MGNWGEIKIFKISENENEKMKSCPEDLLLDPCADRGSVLDEAGMGVSVRFLSPLAEIPVLPTVE